MVNQEHEEKLNATAEEAAAEHTITEEGEERATDLPENHDPSDYESSEPVEEVDEHTRLQNEVATAKDKYLRLFAEFENFRRRTAKERLDLVKNGRSGRHR